MAGIADSATMTNRVAAAGSRLDASDAQVLAERHFGIRGRATPLSGERDENFLISTFDNRYVLKVTHPSEDRGAITFQTRALLHVAHRDPDLPTPRVLPTSDRRHEADVQDALGRPRTVRLLSFLPGTMAASQPITPTLRTALGRTLARFDRALEDFSDPADCYGLDWDITQASTLRSIARDVAQPAARANVERALERFEATIVPALPDLRRQVIHNDLTPFNFLLADGDSDMITGVLDFGDMIRAPLINDLAIACAYHVGRRGDPLATVLDVVVAYHAVNPIRREECDLIFDLMATRLAITVAITERNAVHNPHNRAYILKNHPTAVAGLAQLGTLAREEAQRRLRSACGLEA